MNHRSRLRVDPEMRLLTCLPMLVTVACATVPATGPAPPTGARIEPSGYASIRTAPPAPYDPPPRVRTGWEAPLPPGETRLPTDDVEILQHRWERGISLTQARTEIRQLRADAAEAQAVAAKAGAAEPDNFVLMRIRRERAPAWTFAFKRDPEASLRRYTTNPRFLAEQRGYSPAEQEALVAAWWPRFEPYAAGSGQGADGITFIMKISESEFRALAPSRDFPPVPGLKLEFPAEPDLPRITADAAPFVRIFPQQLYFPGIIVTGGRRYRGDARVILRDGCLFFGTALVRLNRTMGLFRDPGGYLALRDPADPAKPPLRIGERISGGGGYSEPIDAAGRAAITAQCGNHPIVDLYSPESAVNRDKYLRSQFSSGPGAP